MIFLLGRYHERRNEGLDREAAFYDMYRGTSHVILGSGLTIAGAVFCLSFTRMPYFQSLGIPAAIGVLVSLVASLTLAPAVIVIGGRFGLLEPKRKTAKRGWRRIGTAIVRWPGPILIATLAIAFIGIAALPGYKVSYDIGRYMPASTPVQRRLRRRGAALLQGAAQSRTADDRNRPRPAQSHRHDPAGAGRQGRLPHRRHRPGAVDHPAAGHAAGPHLDPVPDQHARAPRRSTTCPSSRTAPPTCSSRSASSTTRSTSCGSNTRCSSSPATSPTSRARRSRTPSPRPQDLRDKIANFDDFFRPLRNYFYWEPHCFDIPVCWAFRSLFDALDGIDELTDQLANVSGSIAKLDALQPKLLALIPPQIANQQTNRDLTMTNYATTAGIYDQTQAALQNSTALGQAYDASKTDDSFYLPPEAFSNPEFQRGLKLFLSPDGKAARMIITHDVDPATPEGISHIDPIRHAAQEAVKGTPLAGSKIYIGGTAATYKDIGDMAHYDLIIAGIASLSLILLIMMFITRSLVAALVIVGTVALSLGASVGLSVLVWQHLLGTPLYWVILPLAVILLLAVGSDYNLLLVSRFKEEIHAGINTGIIRSMAGSGSVVTAAGLVFAFTMASFIFSDLLVLGQIGTTIALGLLFDTLIVRSFMTPSIAALLGRWFWWPVQVRPRPVPAEVRRREHPPACHSSRGRPGDAALNPGFLTRPPLHDWPEEIEQTRFRSGRNPPRAGALVDVRTDDGIDECRPIEIGAKRPVRLPRIDHRVQSGPPVGEDPTEELCEVRIIVSEQGSETAETDPDLDRLDRFSDQPPQPIGCLDLRSKRLGSSHPRQRGGQHVPAVAMPPVDGRLRDA